MSGLPMAEYHTLNHLTESPVYKEPDELVH